MEQLISLPYHINSDIYRPIRPMIQAISGVKVCSKHLKETQRGFDGQSGVQKAVGKHLGMVPHYVVWLWLHQASVLN